VHINGQRITRREAENTPSVRGEPKREHIQRWTTEGREIVGPGYSACGRNVAVNNWHIMRREEHRADASHARPCSIKMDRGGATLLGILGKGVSMGSCVRLRHQDAVPQVGERKELTLRWCPLGLSKTQWQRLQKLRQVEFAKNV
jgi:hypothetical protein